MEYEHDDIATNYIDQQTAQSNNIGSSSRSSDWEMHAQHEKIVRTIWDEYIKE